MKRTLRRQKLFWLAGLAWATLAPAALADKALRLNRTEHTSNNIDSAITQPGQAMWFRLPVFTQSVDNTVGFWVKRDPEEGVDEFSNREDGVLLELEGGDVQVSLGIVPQDYKWHYVYVRIDRDQNWFEAYIDGADTPAQKAFGLPANLFARNIIRIGAEYPFGKRATQDTLLIDDLSVWKGHGAAVTSIHKKIAKFGTGQLDLSSTSILRYYSFTSVSTLASDNVYLDEDKSEFSNFSGNRINDALYLINTVSITEDNLVDDTGDRLTRIQVTVASDFGASEVFPPVGETEFDFDPTGGETIEFSAPQFVYLDRYGNELGTSDDDVSSFLERSYYRARNVGYTGEGLDGGNSGAERLFSQSQTGDISLVWEWEIEYAVIVDTATSDLDGLEDALGNATVSAGFDAPQNRVGRHWVSGNTIVSTAIDGIINPDDTGNGPGARERFAMKDYLIENAPGDTGHALTLSRADNDYLDGGNTGIFLNNANATSFTIEFWARIDLSFGPTSDQNVISFGEATGVLNQLRIGFRRETSANNFFVLANNAGSAAEVDADFTDRFWHHWAVVYDLPNKDVLVYRDGELVAENLNFTLNYTGTDYLVIGGRNSSGVISDEFPGTVDNVRVWTTVRSESEIEDSMTTQQYGSQTGLALELTFDNPSLTALTSTEGSGLTFVLQNSDDPFPAAVTDAEKLEVFFPELRFTDLATPPSRVSTEEITIQDWLRVTWRWKHQLRLRVEVNDPAFQGLPFVATEDGDFLGAGDVWATKFSTVTIGTYYRTLDRCFTLSDIVGQVDALTEITLDTVSDATRDGRATRQFTLASIENPGELVFTYDDTIFRAEIALGEGLDVSSTASLNLQLVPDLCEGGELHLNAGSPDVVSSNPERLNATHGGAQGQSGRDVLFDTVGQQLLPLKPGIFHLQWKDASDPETLYNIVVAADFPTETLTFSWDREDDDGYRLNTEGGRFIDAGGTIAREVTFGGVSEAFPGSDTAHYRVLYDAQSAPPMDLDSNSSDRWAFNELTYSTAKVLMPDRSSLLQVTSPGKIVLLYSYAPDASDVAKGDASREAYLTRLVEALSMDDRRLIHTDFSTGNQSAALFDGTTDRNLQITPASGDNGSAFTLADDTSTTVEFWARLSDADSNSTPAADRVVFEQSGASSSDPIVQLGFRGPEHPTDPGRFYVGTADASAGFIEDFSAAAGSLTYMLYGAAERNPTGQYLVLNEDLGGQRGSIVIENPLRGAPVTDLNVRFRVRVDSGDPTPADGFSFSFGPDLPDSAQYGENGLGGGLRVSFTTFGGERIRLIFGGSVLATADSTALQNAGISLLTGIDFVEVEVDLQADGTASVFWNDIPVPNLQGVLTAYNGSAGWRYAFGSRTGGSTELHYLDDIVLAPNLSEFDLAVIDPGASDLVVDNHWHHWAVTHGGGLVRLFMDGRLIGSEAQSLAAVAADFSHWRIGQSLRRTSGPLGDLDNFRIWDRVLSAEEIRQAMVSDIPASAAAPVISAHFDDSPAGGTIPHDGTSAATLISSLSDPADLLVIGADGPAEVATRIQSKVDTAGLDTGYILHELSNYNGLLYDQEADPGAWGPIFPVNWSGIFDNELDIVFYENPYRHSADTATVLHPNVDWPYVVMRYEGVGFPAAGQHKDNRIYIASRLGSEGVDATGADQLVFDPAALGNFSIYNQPDPLEPGWNPNEEHALIAPSIKDQLTGDTAFNLGQKAVFALQNGLNVWGENDSNVNSTANDPNQFSSEPWVLVQYQDVETEEWQMAAYRVETVRSGAVLFPALDPVTHDPVDGLGQPVAQPADPAYDFDYRTFAGDTLVPPYPLNLVIGNVIMPQGSGGQLDPQRTLWQDINGNYWVAAGESADTGDEFFFRYWYPFREDFWYDPDLNGSTDLNIGEAIAWLPSNGRFTEDDVTAPEPRIIRYDSFWRDDYPVLKRGETATYAGGEHAAENFDAEGLPAIVAWASGQVIFDSAFPLMVFDEPRIGEYSARLIRPLDRMEADFSQTDFSPSLTPANTEAIMVDGSRWYFKALSGSLQKRFYYDSLSSKLVFRGRLNDLEGGDPDLTATPVSLSILEPNVLTQAEYQTLVALDSSNSLWTGALEWIYEQSQNPHGTDLAVDTTQQRYYAGMEPSAGAFVNQPGYYTYSAVDDTVSVFDVPGFLGVVGYEDRYQHLNSLGTGAALAPNPNLLTATYDAPLYVTLAENNHPGAGGAISLHIIRIGDDRFRGAIKVVEAQNVFDEKINLRHTGDFGGNTEEIFYQWWVRDVISLDQVGFPDTDAGWQLYAQGLGLNLVEFAGRPDIVLADKFFFVRYGERDEFLALGDDPGGGSVSDASWRLVDFDGDTYDKTAAGSNDVPYQWAGAANSPQLQADGSKRYIPQLVMGWVKRVLDRVNPYEARFSDFFNNESPATYSSMLQIAGKPFIGKVALNSDKNAIENVGLIELYETVLARAKELTLKIDGAATDGTNQALLLAATRLAFLYELLAREAYSDAQNPLIPVTTDNGLAPLVSYVHAFQNLEPSLLHEELALLRGTDFLKAYPAFNRLFWNYVKGPGEAAYNAVYNIQDSNEDGFINEFDAAEQYPQGHGDAWGHFLSAHNMHYELLRHTSFDWRARAELYSLLDNVIETDYLDEKSFARTAAAKARTGAEIVRATYRLAYTEDPRGQWQGYTDTDAARAWGVSEWAKRAGQGALFDWAIGQALLPADADQAAGREVEGLEELDRGANRSELGEIAAALQEAQTVLDEANSGANPLGLDSDAVVFDLDPRQIQGGPLGRATHFEQVYERAVAAALNAASALRFASQANRQLRREVDETRFLQIDALRQDIDYRNRLIEIFGRPYEGTIGPGQVFAEGYIGPDTLLYLYIDQVDPGGRVPAADARYVTLTDTDEAVGSLSKMSQQFSDVEFPAFLLGEITLFDDQDAVEELFDSFFLNEPFETAEDLAFELPVVETADYAFLAEESWGRRTAYGRVHRLLAEMLAEEAAFQRSVREYREYVEQVTAEGVLMEHWLKSQRRANHVRQNLIIAQAIDTALLTLSTILRATSESAWNMAWQAGLITETFFPTVIGFSNDATSAARGSAKAVAGAVSGVSLGLWTTGAIGEAVTTAAMDTLTATAQGDLNRIGEFKELARRANSLRQLLSQEEARRLTIAQHAQRLEILAQDFQTTLAEGFRLLDEREAFNQVLASKAQRHRYADMMTRLARNEALTQYQNASQNAVRYAWLAAKAYDYETGLGSGDPAAATGFLEEIVKTRQLGLWENGQPRLGQSGLAAILARLKQNFDVLKGQLGLNNPQLETGRLSLRHEHFRIAQAGFTSDERWQRTLQRARVPDLWSVAEFRQYCRPFADPKDGAQPGLVIEFGTEIQPGRNVFGRQLGGRDHAFSSANFATKINSVGLWFQDYQHSGLSTTPRVYLVPAGSDVVRVSDADIPQTRTWNVVEQRIPMPFTINETHLTNPNFIPSIHGLNGSFADLRRFGDFRAYPAFGVEAIDRAQLTGSSRLIGRSVWNTRWLLIIPGATLHADAEAGLDQFVKSISDIQLVFETYSHEGM